MISARNNSRVKWEELLPEEFLQRLEANPAVFLPMGICEPHGHIAPFGLDTLKAEYLCEEAAKRFGGVAAPALGYQIHETGFHAPWLEEVVGEVNPRMTAMPTHIILHFFLYQLRAFVNAGFRTVYVVSGHAGGNQEDLRLAAGEFMKAVPVNVLVKADPELAGEPFEGDHAGKYEISQLLYLRPDLMDMERLERIKTAPFYRFAQGMDAPEASAETGEEIMEMILGNINKDLEAVTFPDEARIPAPIHYDVVEQVWQAVFARKPEWVSLQPMPGQSPVSENSRWKGYERLG